MNESQMNISFNNFEEQRCSAMSKGLFEGVKLTYGRNVMKAVSCFSKEFGEEAGKLLSLLLPEMKKVLGRQWHNYVPSCLGMSGFETGQLSLEVNDTDQCCCTRSLHPSGEHPYP